MLFTKVLFSAYCILTLERTPNRAFLWGVVYFSKKYSFQLSPAPIIKLPVTCPSRNLPQQTRYYSIIRSIFNLHPAEASFQLKPGEFLRERPPIFQLFVMIILE